MPATEHLQHTQRNSHSRARRAAPQSFRQELTLILGGITAADSLQWLRDPEPPALGGYLRSIAVRAGASGDRIHLNLLWKGTPPPPAIAAQVAGLPPGQDVIEVREDAAEPSG